jgi:hypothetical protein
VATAQRARPLVYGRSGALPLDRIGAHQAKAIDDTRGTGDPRAAGTAPGAESRVARGPLRDCVPPSQRGEAGRQTPTSPCH